MSKNHNIIQQLMEIDGREGLPEEIFIAVSTIVPVANVDLLVLDSQNHILLSWRDDVYFGKGWHLPGGCIRYKETMAERIQKTAVQEIGTEVLTDAAPIAVRDVIMGRDNVQVRERAHHVAILYRCRLPANFSIDNAEKSKGASGYLQWFEAIPEDILPIHEVYQDVFKQFGLMP